jgi:hypothetical protein
LTTKGKVLKCDLILGLERHFRAQKGTLRDITNLMARAKGRNVVGADDSYQLRELWVPYSDILVPENDVLSAENGYLWNTYPEILTR